MRKQKHKHTHAHMSCISHAYCILSPFSYHLHSTDNIFSRKKTCFLVHYVSARLLLSQILFSGVSIILISIFNIFFGIVSSMRRILWHNYENQKAFQILTVSYMSIWFVEKRRNGTHNVIKCRLCVTHTHTHALDSPRHTYLNYSTISTTCIQKIPSTFEMIFYALCLSHATTYFIWWKWNGFLSSFYSFHFVVQLFVSTVKCVSFASPVKNCDRLSECIRMELHLHYFYVNS